LLLAPSLVTGQDRVHPLQPPDRSSPRATLKTFLDSCDATAAFMANDYLKAPSLQKYQHLISLAQVPEQCLDLSEVPPSARLKVMRSAVAALYETLNRLELPSLNDIPDVNQTGGLGATNVLRWVVPNTEIAIVRAQDAAHQGQFLFSPDTVDRAEEFYQRVRTLPYIRPVALQGFFEKRAELGGWLISPSWIEAMPAWARTPLAGQSGWKWLALGVLLLFFSLLSWCAYRLSLGRSNQNPFRKSLAHLALPLFVLLGTPVVAYLALVQINMIGATGSALQLAATALIYLSAAWLSWRVAPVIAEAIIAHPTIAPESIDANLIRICTRLLGLIAAASFLAIGADRIGMPVYGIIAGLGVGGLAIALAAQPNIENLIGSLSLFADKSLRVGDFCKCGDSLGTVEAIGIRSTRIRAAERTITTIPNGMLSKMPLVNFTQRDQLLLKPVVSVRIETTAEQLRFLLAKLREMLLAHPRIQAQSARARLIGFGPSSRDIEVFAYALTADYQEFLGIQEDVFLRIIDIVQQSGTGFALPSQTLYLSRDPGTDDDQTEAAEAQVRQWRAEGNLPFPDFSPEYLERIRASLAYPPPGSPKGPSASLPEAHSSRVTTPNQTTGSQTKL
jgi:MscS family membrane protein